MVTSIFLNSQWRAQLSDGSIFDHPNLNVLCLHEFGNYLIYSLVGTENWLVAKNRITGTELKIHPSGQAGGFFECLSDSHYVVVSMALKHGKHSSIPGELLLAYFDLITGQWLDFSSQPALNVFKNIGASSDPYFLWVHNGHQVNGYEGNDPGGVIINYKLISVNEIWWTSQEFASAVVTSFSKWKRTISLPSGEMSAISQSNYWPVTSPNYTEPDWLRL